MHRAIVIVSMILAAQVFSLGAFAQLDKEIKVVKKKKWEMTEAFKINLTPQIVDTSTYKPAFEYKIVPYQFKTDFVPEPIKPARMLPEPSKMYYGNYVKLGFGSDLSPLAEVRVHGSTRKMAWGTAFKHHSSFGKFKINDLDYYPNFNTNEVSLFMNKHLKKRRVFDANIDLSSLGYKYYGFDLENATTSIDRDSLFKQNFILLSGGVGLASNSSSKSKIKYDLDLDYYLFMDKEDAQEQGVELDVNLRDKFKSSLVGIDGNFGYYTHKVVNDTFNNIYLTINPWVQRTGEDWKFTIGVNSYIKIDPDDNAQTYFYPNLQFEYNLADKFLQSYFGFTGHLEKNYYKTLSAANPFLWSGYGVRPSSYQKNIYAGFKGILTSKIQYNIKASYYEIKDAALFVGNTNLWNNEGYRFGTVYTDMDAVNLFGEISYQGNEKLEMHVGANYYEYFTIKSEEYAYHKPNFDVTLKAAYNLQKKIWITADVFVLGKRMAKEIIVSSPVSSLIDINYLELPEVYDVNLGVEYRYTKKVGAFLKLNNVLGSKYYVYNYYPAQKFHVTAGVTYSF